MQYQADQEVVSLTVKLDIEMPVEVILPWWYDKEPKIEGAQITESLIERTSQGYQIIGHLNGSGEIRVANK